MKNIIDCFFVCIFKTLKLIFVVCIDALCNAIVSLWPSILSLILPAILFLFDKHSEKIVNTCYIIFLILFSVKFLYLFFKDIFSSLKKAIKEYKNYKKPADTVRRICDE